ncbi:PDZ and LIM domain protein Zasp isoform X9 [Glossina fuscipes]|uniref:PDZ and LIM domain protein Zasp isoform X9 n=1 Tax=Glossina fuscipes TaxID=7396 RepID=A0A9C5Z8J6_9MUSC|nr:PDZ and LIM domain protein Zasp isoform X9 [Glossina fuscipes]
MSQPQLLQIKLSRFDAQPWGFRLQGGVDFASPLLVQKVNGGSLAEQAGLMPGDSVVKINDVDVFNLRHKEAQDVVVRSGNNFVMTVQRGGSTWRPQITPTGQLPQPNSPYLQTVTKTSLAHKQLESQHVGCGYNNAAKPFTQGVDGSVKSIVNKQYNSPVGIYSDESIAETLSAQAEVLAGGVLGVNFKKNEKEYHAEKSEVLKLLREEESGKSTPVTCVETAASSTSNFYWTHSHAIGGNERRYTSVSQKQHDERTGTKLQHQTLAPAATHRPNLSATMATQTGNKFKPIDEHQSGGSEAAITTDNDFATASASQPDPRLIVMPVCPALQTPEYKAELEAAAAAAAQDGSPRPLSAGGHPACQMCGVGIVGVFVRIKDKNLHVECFKCATCGTSLKNQGYYNFNNKLYCDIHAKLAALQNPPAGTEGYVPVPIKPNTKLSASTISSALSAHGYNGVANGNSGTPTPSSVVAPNASTSIIVSSSQVDKVRDSVNSNCNSNCTTVTNATNEMFPTMATMPSNITSADNGDKPFEYVTLTGNVIRSVVPPGKGSNVNYKVSQGYVRPFGAIPATTTPRSSVIYPPQPQQWSASAPPPTQSKPISNPYATLPRSNVGQQVQQMSIRSHASSNLTQEQKSSYSSTYESATAKTVSSKIDTQEIIQETAEDLEHSEVIFPPPSPLSHMKQKATLSGLHRPETLPKYQRNWTVLPTQSPVRTPEPSELRENVPLAFVDTPKTPRVADGVESNAVHKPVAKLCAQTSASSTVAQSSITSASTVSNYQQRVSEQRQQQSATLANSNACTQHTVPTTVPIIIEDRSGPVTMAFQSIDEHMIRDESQTPSRPYTPSSFTNKPAPIIPPYQTPEKLCFDECAPTHGKLYDRCSVSPLPDRARSPAPGPPPNPLAAIRAPRLKDDEMASVSQRMLQAGSITTGQSYLGAQQAKQQGQLLAHTETSSQSAMQSYMEKPEKHDQLKVGNVVVQKTEKESRLEEQKQSQLESHTKTQMGNVQIERRRKVTEEFEHTSSAKTTEIRTGSQNASSERRQSYGKTGYVANQAKRLSGLEEEISNLSSQSQAISARAANLTETKFPEVHGEGGAALFPSKPMVPSYSESKTASYVVSGAPDIKMVSSFAGKTMQPQEHLSNVHEASVVSAKQQQQKSLSAYSSNISSSVASCSQQQQQRQANAVSCSLTKASATNQAYATSIATNQYTSTTSQNVCPTMGALCGSRDTCCKSQQPVQTPSVNNYNNNYRPNASAGLTDFEPPQTRATSFAAPQSVMQTPLTAPAPTTTAVPTSTNYNIGSNVADGSSGGMASKGGAYGATSAPKRGRGIINKAVGPGVRVPLCNSCNTQIRGPFITALGRIWCPEHFICVNANCRRALQDIGFVEEKGDLYCEYCFEKYLAPTCSKCGNKIKGDCLNAIGKHFHPECFNCAHCGKLFGNTPFFLEDGNPYCEADWNELFTTKCFACGFPVEAGDRWVEALNHNYHSQCFNCTYCKQNLEGQSFYNKGGRPFCKNHAR